MSHPRKVFPSRCGNGSRVQGLSRGNYSISTHPRITAFSVSRGSLHASGSRHRRRQVHHCVGLTPGGGPKPLVNALFFLPLMRCPNIETLLEPLHMKRYGVLYAATLPSRRS